MRHKWWHIIVTVLTRVSISKINIQAIGRSNEVNESRKDNSNNGQVRKVIWKSWSDDISYGRINGRCDGNFCTIWSSWCSHPTGDFLLSPSYVHLYQYNPRLQTNIIYKLQAIWQRHLWRIQGFFNINLLVTFLTLYLASPKSKKKLNNWTSDLPNSEVKNHSIKIEFCLLFILLPINTFKFKNDSFKQKFCNVE